VAFFLMAAAGRNVSERAEMQAWLEARSSRRRQEPTDVRDAAQAPVPE
jgi:hypothetical protein